MYEIDGYGGGNKGKVRNQNNRKTCRAMMVQQNVKVGRVVQRGA